MALPEQAAGMRWYRACWVAAVWMVVGPSIVLGCLSVGWGLVAAQVVAVGVFGAAFGAAWEEGSGRQWRVARTWAAWSASTAVVLTGLPVVIGSWSLLVLVGLGVLSPPVVGAARQRLQGRGRGAPARSPAQCGDDELTRRWRATSRGVRSTWLTAEQRVALAAERQDLLDELERRDPAAFQDWLAREGWREAQEH
jgi:hypothetical protein